MTGIVSIGPTTSILRTSEGPKCSIIKPESRFLFGRFRRNPSGTSEVSPRSRENDQWSNFWSDFLRMDVFTYMLFPRVLDNDHDFVVFKSLKYICVALSWELVGPTPIFRQHAMFENLGLFLRCDFNQDGTYINFYRYEEWNPCYSRDEHTWSMVERQDYVLLSDTTTTWWNKLWNCQPQSVSRMHVASS